MKWKLLESYPGIRKPDFVLNLPEVISSNYPNLARNLSFLDVRTPWQGESSSSSGVLLLAASFLWFNSRKPSLLVSAFSPLLVLKTWSPKQQGLILAG